MDKKKKQHHYRLVAREKLGARGTDYATTKGGILSEPCSCLCTLRLPVCVCVLPPLVGHCPGCLL